MKSAEFVVLVQKADRCLRFPQDRNRVVSKLAMQDTIAKRSFGFLAFGNPLF
jgi:hypothetical protein